MNDKKAFPTVDFLVASIGSFFGIGFVRLLLTPLSLFIFVKVTNRLTQPWQGISTSIFSLLLIAIVMILLQTKYSTKLNKSIIYGVWLGWALQLCVSFIPLLISF